MRQFLKTKKGMALGLVAALAITAGAIAYWTSSGTGSGSASVGADNGLTISSVSIPDTLYPGTDSAVTFSVDNDSADAPVKFSDVVVDESTYDNGLEGLPVGCSADDFTFTSTTTGAEIPANGSQPGSGTLAMADTGSNQNACKSANLTLHLKVDNSGL